ncbi:hypothetical protein CBR_g38577 [Chara braunii]|uniref:Uncharacterized protein n=1 Tax=Chara braunii TaxID=69332 RepID=A0A388K0D2_CHABU|nr:hypothetical protein CBR_g38577 [Chara braunii]|eukprot:GBG63509.1 hypothetical protein CBR_g38577 [Chara braunii]
MAEISFAQWQAMLDAANENEKPFFQKLYDDAVQREKEAEAAARAANVAEQVALLEVSELNDDRFKEKLAAAVAALVRLRTFEDVESHVTTLEQRNQELQAEIDSLKQSRLSAPRPPNPRPAAVPTFPSNTVLVQRSYGVVISTGTGANSSSSSPDSSALVPVPNTETSAPNTTVRTGVPAAAQTVASLSSGPAAVATPSPQQLVIPPQGQQQGPSYPKTPMKPPVAFSGEKKDEELNTWLRTVPIWVKAKRTLPEVDVIIAASYLEGKAAKWLDGVIAKAGYGHRMADWANTLTLEEFVDMVETRWHNPQQAQIATDVMLRLDQRRYKSVRELTTTVENLIVVPNIRYDNQKDPVPMDIMCKLEAKDKVTEEEFVMVDGLLFLSKAGVERLALKVGRNLPFGGSDHSRAAEWAPGGGEGDGGLRVCEGAVWVEEESRVKEDVPGEEEVGIGVDVITGCSSSCLDAVMHCSCRIAVE